MKRRRVEFLRKEEGNGSDDKGPERGRREKKSKAPCLVLLEEKDLDD